MECSRCGGKKISSRVVDLDTSSFAVHVAARSKTWPRNWLGGKSGAIGELKVSIAIIEQTSDIKAC